jgi:hypothetical protein
MDGLRPSRRQVLRASLIGGIAVYLAPLGSRTYAALFDDGGLTPPAWNTRDSTLKIPDRRHQQSHGRKGFRAGHPCA